MLDGCFTIDLREHYVLRFWSADKTFGSVTTKSLLKVEARPTEFVASQIYLPSSSSFTHVNVSEQMLFQHFICTCEPLFSISSPSLNHLISGNGSPLICKPHPLQQTFSHKLTPIYLTIQRYNTLLQHFYLPRKNFHKLRNLMALSYNNCVAHNGFSPTISIPWRDSELILRPRFQIEGVEAVKGRDSKFHPSRWPVAALLPRLYTIGDDGGGT